MGNVAMKRQSKRVILLFSLILVVIPMVIFPARMGLPLVSGSAVFMLYEVLYYGAVLFFFRRQTTLATLLIGSALSLVYRMTLGAALGLAIIAMYGIDSTVAFSLGMAKYLPAVLLQVAVTPFVLRPFYLSLARTLTGTPPRRHAYTSPAPVRPADQEIKIAAPVKFEERAGPVLSGRRSDSPMPAVTLDDGNQFERAMAYLGEASAVRMALVVDEEGLLLARFNRCEEDPELWAPLAIILEGYNRQVLNRYRRGGDPDKIDIGTRQMRILVRRIEHVILMVLAERHADETVLIRSAQAAEMIRKYMSERYSPALFARVEERYVSNT